MKNKVKYALMSLTSIALVACTNTNLNSPIGKESSTEDTTITSSTSSEETKGTKTINNKRKNVYDTDRKNYSEIDYDKWNHDDEVVAYTNKVKIKGKVLQEGSLGSDRFLRVAVDDDYDKVVFVNIAEDKYTDVIADNDQIIVYGYANGRYSYESTFNAEITIPYMEAYFYDLNEKILEEESKSFETKVYYDKIGIKIEQLTNDTFKITNNSDKVITPSIDSLDVDGIVSDDFSFTNFYGDLRPGQSRISVLKDSEGNMKEGATINVYVKIIDDYYNKLDEFSFSYKLQDDIKARW